MTNEVGLAVAGDAVGSPDLPVVRIGPSRGWMSLGLNEVWEYRELLYFLVWRDINIRYKQTVLGVAWAIIQPVLAMAVFSLFLGKLAKIPSDGIPYPLFSYTALVPWAFFANGLNLASNCLVRDADLIRKVYFPRVLIPMASVLAGVLDFALGFTVLIAMMVAYRISPTANVLWLPPLLLLAVVASFSVGLWLSALNVKFRDVRHIVPFLTQVWLFLTPVVYPSNLLPHSWRLLYAVNPMAGVIEGFRWALLGTNTRPTSMIIVSALTVLVLLMSGLVYFGRTEKTFADVV